MTEKRNSTFVLPAGLKSWATLILLGIWSAARAEATGPLGNIRKGDGEVAPRKPRIINGVIVEDLRYPYFSLMYGQGMCGGVLIAPQLVLSAAHCDGAADLIRIGAFEDKSDGQPLTIRSTIVHPEYDKFGFDYDIMIFQLKQKTDYPYVALERKIINEGKFTVLGFGDTDKGFPLELSDKLQEVELEYVDNDTCDKGHGDYGEVKKDMMCVEGDKKDSCIGDSGGPLIIKGDSIDDDKLVGLVSWGDECAKEGAPGVYVRISYFYDWIVETVCENFPDDAPSYMKCEPSYKDSFIINNTPSTKPTRTPTNVPTKNPTIAPTIEPTPTLSPFPSDSLGNQTDAPTFLDEAISLLDDN